MTNLEERIKDWEKKDEELDSQIALFEKQFRHPKPCEEYKRTGYCVHLVNAQQRKFGKDTKAHIENIIDISGR